MSVGAGFPMLLSLSRGLIDCDLDTVTASSRENQGDQVERAKSITLSRGSNSHKTGPPARQSNCQADSFRGGYDRRLGRGYCDCGCLGNIG